ncbi:unnamed protein product [Rotaria sp. Silwood2]|nr:unnamed protein product [Rotaria sp. Silwood2]
MNDVEAMLSKLRHLRHLELSAVGSADLANAYRWEILSKCFVTLKFCFEIQLNSIPETLDSFRTQYWLIEKRWFVAYKKMFFFTIPHFVQTDADEYFQLPKHSTCSNNAIIYQHVTKLTLINKIIETHHRFMNINTLELHNSAANIDLTSLPGVADLNGIKTLLLPSSIKNKNITFLFKNMRRLENLSISSSADQNFADFFQQTRNMRLEQIRQLTICNHYVISNHYIIGRICRLFPCIQQLNVSIRRVDDMIALIDGLKRLSNASFIFKSLSNNDKQSLWSKVKTIINETYRLEDSCLHVWIENRIDISHPKLISSISWAQRLENEWHRLDFMLSQASHLSIFITIVLIAHLHNIVIHMWIYMMSGIALHSLLSPSIFGSASLTYLTPVGSILSKHLDRPSTYIFCYFFILISIIIGYIFSDNWKSMIADKVSLFV